MNTLRNVTMLFCVLLLAAQSFAGDIYVGPAGSGVEDGSDAENLMPWATWVAGNHASDYCYIVGMDSTISEYLWWPACLGYYADYVQDYATYSIGWRFDQYHQVFQWAAGGCGVVGPVNIIEFIPNPTTAVIGGVTRDIHGSMINPTIGASQGWHGAAVGYSAALNVAKNASPSTPYALQIGDSLVSTYGRSTAPGTAVTYIISASVLHCVSEAPAELSFRPSYAGSAATKIIRAASAIDLDDLPDLAATASAPTYETCQNRARRTWLEHHSDASSRQFRPSYATHNYGPTASAYFYDVVLWACCNHTDGEKRPIVYGLVQNGIDLYGDIVHSGTAGRRFCSNNSGAQGLTKLRALFGAWMLQDATMLALFEKAGDYQEDPQGRFGYTPTDKIHFLEDTNYRVQAKHVRVTDTPWLFGTNSQASSVYSRGGTVTVAQGDTHVYGSGTQWLPILNDQDDKFIICNSTYTRGADSRASSITGTAYTISSIVSGTELILTAPYEDVGGAGQRYTIAGQICLGLGNVVKSQDSREFTEEDALCHLPVWGVNYGSPLSEGVAPTAGRGCYTGSPSSVTQSYEHNAFEGSLGSVLAVLILGLETEWNQPATFAYHDRRVTVEHETTEASAYAISMWNEYRDDYVSVAPLWTPQAHTPVPATGATSVDRDQDLSWYCGNGRSLATTYKIYFDKSTNPPTTLKVSGTRELSYEPGSLDAESTYYWRVDTTVDGVDYTGTVWSLSTGATPDPPTPDIVTYGSPGAGEVDVALNVVLSWTAGAGATSHDVYFGTEETAVTDATTATPTIFRGNQAGVTYDPPETLANATAYYWRVDEVAGSTTKGPTISFTTVAATPVLTGPSDNSTSYSRDVVVTWTGAVGECTITVTDGTPAGTSVQTSSSGSSSFRLEWNTTYTVTVTSSAGDSATHTITITPPKLLILN